MSKMKQFYPKKTPPEAPRRRGVKKAAVNYEQVKLSEGVLGDECPRPDVPPNCIWDGSRGEWKKLKKRADQHSDQQGEQLMFSFPDSYMEVTPQDTARRLKLEKL